VVKRKSPRYVVNWIELSSHDWYSLTDWPFHLRSSLLYFDCLFCVFSLRGQAMKKTADGRVSNLTKLSAQNACKLRNQTFAVTISTADLAEVFRCLNKKELFLPFPFSYSFVHFPNLWCVFKKYIFAGLHCQL
jgi:hypothetical protein